MGRVIDPKLDTRLLLLLGSQDFVEAWWNSPNVFFGLKTPLEVYETNPKIVSGYLALQCYSEGS